MSLQTIDFTKAPRKAPKCLECGELARLGTGADAYPDEPELHDRPMWICSCGAYATCKPGTIIPIGRPASRETRAKQVQLRIEMTHLREALISAGVGRKRSHKIVVRAAGVGFQTQMRKSHYIDAGLEAIASFKIEDVLDAA